MSEEQKLHHPTPPAEEDKEEEEAHHNHNHNHNNNHSHDHGHRGRMTDNKHCTRLKQPPSARRLLCAATTIFLLLAGATALAVYLVYRPHKPQFSVTGAAVYTLNVTSPPLISTAMQFTITARNPNRRVSIYYDRLSAYVTYHGQAITPPLALPPLHHGRRATVSVSPVLGGRAVPVAPEVAAGLAVDEEYGVVGLRVVVMGRLRWKAGAIRTGHYGLYVRCDVLVGLRNMGGLMGQPPLLGSHGCKVDV